MTLPTEEVIKTLKNYKRESEAIENNIMELVMYMPNGGLSLEEGWMLSPKQRVHLVKKINDYMEKRYGNNNKDYIVNEG